MDPHLRDLIDRLNQLSEQFEELREGVRMAVDGASVDPDMALIRSRKVLEYVVRDVFVRRVGEPPGTRPLESLIQRLVKDGHFPPPRPAHTQTTPNPRTPGPPPLPPAPPPPRCLPPPHSSQPTPPVT